MEISAHRSPVSIGGLREALVSFMDLGGAWGQNMHESKQVMLRLGQEVYPLRQIAASFHDGAFVLMLDAEPREPEPEPPGQAEQALTRDELRSIERAYSALTRYGNATKTDGREDTGGWDEIVDRAHHALGLILARTMFPPGAQLRIEVRGE